MDDSRALRSSYAVQVARLLAWLFTIGAAVQCLLTLISSRIEIAMPVDEFWPRLPRGTELDGVEAKVVGGGFSQAFVELEGLSGKAVALDSLGTFLLGAISVLLGLLVVALCNRLLRGPRNDAALLRNLRISAGFVLVAGFVAQYCQIVAGRMAAVQVLEYDGASWSSGKGNGVKDLNDIVGLPLSGGDSWTLDFWPVFLALGLLVVAATLRTVPPLAPPPQEPPAPAAA